MRLRLSASCLSLLLSLTLAVVASAADKKAAEKKAAAQKAATKDDPVNTIARTLTPTRTLVYKRVGDVELSLHLFEPKGHKSTDRRAQSRYLFSRARPWLYMKE